MNASRQIGSAISRALMSAGDCSRRTLPASPASLSKPTHWCRPDRKFAKLSHSGNSKARAAEQCVQPLCARRSPTIGEYPRSITAMVAPMTTKCLVLPVLPPRSEPSDDQLLHLVAHLVAGHVAFDIASRVCDDCDPAACRASPVGTRPTVASSPANGPYHPRAHAAIRSGQSRSPNLASLKCPMAGTTRIVQLSHPHHPTSLVPHRHTGPAKSTSPHTTAAADLAASCPRHPPTPNRSTTHPEIICPSPLATKTFHASQRPRRSTNPQRWPCRTTITPNPRRRTRPPPPAGS